MEYSYYDDLNIDTVAETVIEKLQTIIDSVDTYIEEYDRYKVISEMSHNPIDRAKALEMVHKYDMFIEYAKDGTLVDKYTDAITKYLEIYRSLSSKSRVFGMDTCRNIPKRVGTIGIFLQETAKFIDIKWDCTYNMSRICTRCYGHTKKVSTIMVCTKCGHSYATDNIKYLKAANNNVKGESTYKARKNYDKEYRHVCGLLHSVTPDQVADVEAYLYRSNIHEPTRDDIRSGIKICGYRNYNDVNYVYSQITREPLPPIDRHIIITGERFEKYYHTFRNVGKEGKNITNIHFLIRLFLWQEGIKYDESWFSTLSERTRDKHRRNAKRVCDTLKLQYPDEIWNYPDDWQ